MRFTKEQYEQAIKDLQDGLTQMEPNGNGCHICGDSGHQAFECGSNPLYAIACCRHISEKARELHTAIHDYEVSDAYPLNNGNIALHMDATTKLLDQLHEFMHYLGGDNTWMGETYGPAKVRPL